MSDQPTPPSSELPPDAAPGVPNIAMHMPNMARPVTMGVPLKVDRRPQQYHCQQDCESSQHQASQVIAVVHHQSVVNARLKLHTSGVTGSV